MSAEAGRTLNFMLYVENIAMPWASFVPVETNVFTPCMLLVKGAFKKKKTLQKTGLVCLFLASVFLRKLSCGQISYFSC